MDSEFWDAVRERAHQLWVQDGCIDGRSEEHWQQAQHDVIKTMNAVPAPAEQAGDAEPPSAFSCTGIETEPKGQIEAEVRTLSKVEAPSKPPPHPQKTGTPLLKTGSGQCRYIISDTYSPAICCGAPSGTGSWCQEHRARIFARSSGRTLRPEKLRAEPARF